MDMTIQGGIYFIKLSFYIGFIQ